MEYYGDSYTEDAENIELYLSDANETTGIYLDLLTKNGNTTLEPGTYHFRESRIPYSILYGEVQSGNNYANVTGGTIVVSKSGNVFSIVFNLSTEIGTLTGSCSKTLPVTDETDGGGDPIVDSSLSGTISVGGLNVPAAAGRMLYYGAYYDGEGVNVDLQIVNDPDDPTAGLELEMFVPENDTELIAGEYTFGDSHMPFTILSGEAVNGGNSADITGGTVIIVKSGDTYTITFNLTSTAGDVTGTVTGTLDWWDNTNRSLVPAKR